jgi:hypothetical protein
MKNRPAQSRWTSALERGDSTASVYRFLRDMGSGFIQFIPLVKRLPDKEEKVLGLDLASGEGPPGDVMRGTATPRLQKTAFNPLPIRVRFPRLSLASVLLGE